jgi:hypothetical protein
VGTIVTAVTPHNAIVVAPIAYTERDKNASRKRDIWKQGGKTTTEKRKESYGDSRKINGKKRNGDSWNINSKTEKATRFSKGKNTKVKEEVMALAKSQRSLKAWTKQKWRTKSGKPSTQGPKATGERYLPSAAIKSLSSGEYAATTAAKRKGKAQGKQFVAQPKNIKKKVKKFRKVK